VADRLEAALTRQMNPESAENPVDLIHRLLPVSGGSNDPRVRGPVQTNEMPENNI
jgi:hypothetical protein